MQSLQKNLVLHIISVRLEIGKFNSIRKLWQTKFPKTMPISFNKKSLKRIVWTFIWRILKMLLEFNNLKSSHLQLQSHISGINMKKKETTNSFSTKHRIIELCEKDICSLFFSRLLGKNRTLEMKFINNPKDYCTIFRQQYLTRTFRKNTKNKSSLSGIFARTLTKIEEN